MAEVLKRQIEQLTGRLSHETDGDKAAQSLLSLLGLLKNANAGCTDQLVRKNIPLMVVNIMKTNPKSSIVQKVCCQLVSACYTAGRELQELIIKCRAFDQVFNTILSNQEECSVLVQAFDTLHTLCHHEDNLRTLINCKIVQHLVLVLVQYKGQDIQMATLKLLALVISQDHHKLLCNELMSTEPISLITAAVKLFPSHPIIVASVLNVLSVMACSDDNRNQLSQSAGCTSLANDCVSELSKDPIVVAAYCKLMKNLSMSDDLAYAMELLNDSEMNSVERDLVEADVHNTIIKLLDSHSGNPFIQEHGLAALGHLAVLSGVVDIEEDSKLKRWLRIILNALNTHINEPAVQAGACHCLTQLLVSRQDVVKWIGSDPNGQLVPVHSAMVLPLIVYYNDPQVYVAVCSAIYHIMSSVDCQGAVLQELPERAVGSTLEGLREHRNNHVCLEWGCRALRTLIMENNNHKEYMEMCLALFDLLSILEQQDSNPVLLGEAFAVITCLTDIKQLRKEACRQHIYTKVLEAVSKHPSDSFLSEVAIEQLTILLNYREMVDILNDANTIPKVINIMQEHINIPSIQKKGCLLIRLLLKSDDVLTLQKDLSLNSMATTVINALLHRNHDPDVLVEGLACVEALCELSDVIAGHFVTGGIHNLLLTILQQVEDDGDTDRDYILDVAKAILSKLCERTEYKHKMLSLAVKDNLLEGVNILIDMGADVNSYEDTDQSPICLAVQNNNHFMVLNLLAEGVRYVTRALNIAKHNNYHDIIGTLLRHIALEGNKESLDNKSSEVVDLSGLSLRKIKPQWILPALGSTTLLRRMSRPSLLQKRPRYSCDSDVSAGSDAPSELLDDTGRTTEDESTDETGESYHRDSTPIRNIRRYSKEPNIKLPPISSPMRPIDGHDNVFPYHEDGPSVSPSSGEESVFSSPPSSSSPGRSHRSDILYAKPVFELSITGAKSIPFHMKCRRKCSLEHSDSIFPPITNDICIQARSLRRPPQSRATSRAPSPLPGIIHGAVDMRQYFAPQEQDIVPLHISNGQPRVRKLNLSCNALSSLDSLATDGSKSRALYEKLRKLEVLELHQNNLESLPDQLFKKMNSLAVLNLSHNQFEFFPKEALHSEYLTELILSNNKIRKLPTFLQLPHVTLLAFNCNQLREFPSGINGRSFPRLAKLYLSSNLMTVIPDQRYELKNLKELVISKNKLPEIPCAFMRDMESLSVLNASDNEIVRLPGKDGGYLGQLHVVKLNNNLLGKNEENFYHFVTSLPSLHVLEARHNGLSCLYPPTTWSSRCIRDLDFCGNKIEELNFDQCGVRWSRLERLLLGSNRITRIPPELGSVKTLCCLDFSHNPDITKLPDELGNLSTLYVLKIDGLKKLSIDATILNGTPRTIINFLEARLHKSERYYQMKLLVVGGAAKGKTTLIEYLIRNKTLKSPIATLGVNIREWSYEQRPGEVYHLSCWDFAGQGEFYTTHQCFLTTRSLYMVVYDLSKGEEELATISPWLLNIQARAPSSPILVVGTHRDVIAGKFSDAKRMMRSKILNLTDRPGFPSSLDITFAEVSSIDGKGMKELKHKLKDLVDNAKVKGQKIMGGYVPSYYLVLAELIKRKASEVAQTPFPVMYEEELQKQISQEVYHGKMQPLPNSELQQAIHFLHQCGVLLHYSDCQTELGRLYFLNPVWLCKLMARVITIPEVNPLVSNRGLLPISQLGLILRPPEFPEKFILEYIRLLERFEVAFRHCPDELLIPSHLPKEHPVIKLPASTPGRKIVRRYCMCYIPPGFWPRLTARLLIFPKRALQVFNQHQSCFSNDPITQCWSRGVYSIWTDQAYFLVEQLDDQLFDITLPNSNWGTRLLCAVVDNVEAMIDEWYPGLRNFDVVTGKKLVTSGTLCPHCPVDRTPAHCFQLKDLEDKSYETDEVMCPIHKGTVLMEYLAPDIIINDLDDRLKVKQGEFALDESIPNLLGRGGFGEVYKAKHQGKFVAVKVFSTKLAELNGTTPTHLIRQEVSILSYLSHPNIVSLVGVCMRPKPMLLLEYATLGSLRQQQYKTITYNMKHSIMAQVASGLAYLHKKSIIYRDLKADNVLIFSLNPTASVNAKISDYGIACFATASGLALDTGTIGHKAPEVMKGRSSGTYNKEADLYSYGVLLFSLITNYKPFDDLPAGHDQDKAIKENKPIHNIQHYGCPPWPDMEQLIISCLQENPTLRPTAQQVYDRLCTAELIGLKIVIPTHPELSVEAFTFRTFTCEETKSPNVEVWMVSLCGSMTVFSVINLTQKNATLKGKILRERIRENRVSERSLPQPAAESSGEGERESSVSREMNNRDTGSRINCILSVDSNTIIMGSHAGVIYVYDGNRNLKNTLPALPSSILSLLHFQTHKGDHYVCAGLLDGSIALYDQYLLQIEDDQLQAKIFQMGKGPISCMKRHHHKLYVCSGEEVLLINIVDFTVQERWNATHPNYHDMALRQLVIGLKMIWTAQRNCSYLQLWDIETTNYRGTLPCHELVKSHLQKEGHECSYDGYDLRVTSLYLKEAPLAELWVGLGSGHLLIVNASTRVPLMVVHRHLGPVRCMDTVKATVMGKSINLVLTGSYGFVEQPYNEQQNTEKPLMQNSLENYGSLLVWDAAMPQLKPVMDKYRERQRIYL